MADCAPIPGRCNRREEVGHYCDLGPGHRGWCWCNRHGVCGPSAGWAPVDVRQALDAQYRSEFRSEIARIADDTGGPP